MNKRMTGIVLTLAGLFSLAPAAHAARTFCCLDEGGARYCGDILPEACRKRAYSEFNERGVKVRNVEAPLTEAQQAARDAEERRRAEDDKLLTEQKRRDQALLATYASESDLDLAKSRVTSDLDKSIKQFQDRLSTAQAAKSKLQAAVAQLKGQPTPPDLAEQIRRNDAEIQSVTREIESKRKDLERATAKYDAERKRYRELKSGNVAPGSGLGSGPQIPAGEAAPAPAAAAAPAPQATPAAPGQKP